MLFVSKYIGASGLDVVSRYTDVWAEALQLGCLSSQAQWK